MIQKGLKFKMPLSPEQKKFYAENGYLQLSNVFSKEELSSCVSAYDALFAQKVASSSALEAEWGGSWKKRLQEKEPGNSVLSIHNLQCHSGVFTRLLLNDKLLDAVSELIGSPNVLLHHTKAHLKPPKVGAQFPTHQVLQSSWMFNFNLVHNIF